MKCLGLNNKPTAEVHPGHKLKGPKEEEEEEEAILHVSAYVAISRYSFSIKALKETFIERKVLITVTSLPFLK
jgi:hypothetical protein